MADQSGKSSSQPLWRLSGMGMELAGAILGMALLGWLIDRWLGTNPKAVLACLCVGVIGGGYNFIKQALALNKQAAASYRAGHRSAPSADSRPPSGTPNEDQDDGPDPFDPPTSKR